MDNYQTAFRIDHENTDHEYLFVDVAHIGTVVIKAQHDGIVVDLYPLQRVEGEPVASTWVHASELLPDEDSPAPEPPPGRSCTQSHMMTAMCIWEHVDQASMNKDRYPALAAHREAVGTWTLRDQCAALAPYCDRVFDLIPLEAKDGYSFDWELIPLILDQLDLTTPPPPASETALRVTAVLLRHDCRLSEKA